MSALEAALAYARLGYHVIPTHRLSRQPIPTDWPNRATTDPEVVRRWYTEHPEAGVGITGEGIVILDVDVKKDKDGMAVLGPYLQGIRTPTSRTPNGGWHFYFLPPSPDWRPGRKVAGVEVQCHRALQCLEWPSVVKLDERVPWWIDDRTGSYQWYVGLAPWEVSPVTMPEALLSFYGAVERGPERPNVGVPPLLPREELEACWPDVSGWPEKVRRWWDHGDESGYDSRSEAVNGLAWQLYQGSLTDHQVLSVLWEHGWTQGVALEHRRGQVDKALEWLWLSCLKTRETRRPSAAEVFEAQAGEGIEDLYTALYARVTALQAPNTPETLRELAAVLAEGQQLPEVARALLATTVGDARLGMTRAQADRVLNPKRGRKPGSGQANPALAELKSFIWVGPMGRFYDTHHGRMLTKHDLIAQYAHLASETQSPGEVIEEVLRQEKVKFEGLTFRPELPEGPVQEEDGLKWNIYRGPALEPLEGDWQPYLDLFGHMGIDPADRDHILDYFAWMLQHPGERVRHALVIGGRGQGTGKDTLLVPLKMALGRRHVHELKSRNIYARFNGYMLDKRLIVVQEAHQESSAQSRMLEQHLKPFFTADEIEVEQKGIDPFMVRNYAHWVITTNEPHPLHISKGDRRYAMVRVPLEYATEDERSRWEPYWRELYAWFRGGGAQYVLWELMRRDLSHFSPNLAPRSTAWHQEVIEMGLTEEEALVQEALEEEVGVLGWDFFTLDHAWMSVKARFPHQLDKNGRPISQWAVQQALKRFGYTDHRMRFMLKGVRFQFKVWTRRLDILKSRNPEAHWRIYNTRSKKVSELQGGGVTFLPVNSEKSTEDDVDPEGE